MKHCIVMGVCGCGKSTIATAMAEQLDAHFVEADDYHSADNIDRMRNNQALTDANRWPWLLAVATAVNQRTNGCVISCSALTFAYRDFLRRHIENPVCFIHLHGSRDTLLERMNNREGHFMPATMLDSQLETLELLQESEVGVQLAIENSVRELAAAAVEFVQASRLV